MTNFPPSPVLVAGAGPVGLTAALMLARHGTPVRVIDRGDGPTDLSKAAVVWRRTLETLGPVVPVDRFSAEHPVLERVVLGMGAGRLSDVDFPVQAGRAPACVLVPQSATERILLARLHELGVTVQRQTELTGFDARDDAVTCELFGPQGAISVRTPWLVACDGAHSTARHGLSLAFPGETITRRWMLADFDIAATPQPDEHRIQIRLSRGIAALFPMGSGRWRLIASLDTSPPDGEGELRKFNVEEVQGVLDTTDLGWQITALHWTSDFGVNERQVEQYVHGRVLLAGDAAHVHSPAGGQGMNTGIQDAANLAWKVALVQRGAAPMSLLATYNAERHPVGAAVVHQSGALLKTAMAAGAQRFVRDHAAPVALSIPSLQRRLIAFLTEEAVSYRHGPLADGTGKRRGVNSGDGWALSSGAEAELVLLGNAAKDPAPDTFGAPHGFPLTVTRFATDERLAHALGSDSGAMLLRPDGIVASIANNAEAATAWIAQNIQTQRQPAFP